MRNGVEIDFDGQPDDWSAFFDAMKAVGCDFIVRPITEVTADELTVAAAAGVDHVFFYKITASRATEGFAAGQVDSSTVSDLLDAAGIDTSCPCYFDVGVDVLGTAVDQYFLGLADNWSTDQIGVRAGWKIVDYLHTHARVSYFAEILDWQYGHGWASYAQLRQTSTGYGLSDQICKKYTNYGYDGFGQFRMGEGIEPDAPDTAPLAILNATTPHGLVIRWGRTDEMLVLRLKGENGETIEHRGLVQTRNGGLIPRVVCSDLSLNWDKTSVEWLFNNETVSSILRHCVENPSGNCATGIICHIEEPVSDPPKVTGTVYPTIKKGSKGTYVTKLQLLLNQWGRDPVLDTDGVFGSLTKDAVIWFQAGHNDVSGKPLVANGIVDGLTWGALTKATIGGPIRLSSWSGHGKYLREVIDEFAEMTGCMWTLYSDGLDWHFYFGTTANWKEWDTLRDDIDEDDIGGDGRRLILPGGEADIGETNSGFANRVYYSQVAQPPMLPTGLIDWDQVWTEDISDWKTYGNGVVINTGTKNAGFGSNSIKFTYTFTKTASNSIPTYVDLGYIGVPGPLSQMWDGYWGWFNAYVMHRVTSNQKITASHMPRHIVALHMGLHSGAYPGPSVTNPPNCFYNKPNQNAGDKFTLIKWQLYGQDKATQDANGNTLWDPMNVHWIQLRAELLSPKSVTALTTGHTWTLEVWFDQLHPTAITPMKETPTVSQFFVEAQSVTDGKEQAIGITLQDNSIPNVDMESLAMLSLAEHYRTRKTFSTLPVKGIVKPPILSRFPLILSKQGVAPTSYPAVSIARKPFEDVTEFTLGDVPYDEAHADVVIKRTINRIVAQG